MLRIIKGEMVILWRVFAAFFILFFILIKPLIQHSHNTHADDYVCMFGSGEKLLVRVNGMRTKRWSMHFFGKNFTKNYGAMTTSFIKIHNYLIRKIATNKTACLNFNMQHRMHGHAETETHLVEH